MVGNGQMVGNARFVMGRATQDLWVKISWDVQHKTSHPFPKGNLPKVSDGIVHFHDTQFMKLLKHIQNDAKTLQCRSRLPSNLHPGTAARCTHINVKTTACALGRITVPSISFAGVIQCPLEKTCLWRPPPTRECPAPEAKCTHPLRKRECSPV